MTGHHDAADDKKSRDAALLIGLPSQNPNNATLMTQLVSVSGTDTFLVSISHTDAFFADVGDAQATTLISTAGSVHAARAMGLLQDDPDAGSTPLLHAAGCPAADHPVAILTAALSPPPSAAVASVLLPAPPFAPLAADLAPTTPVASPAAPNPSVGGSAAAAAIPPNSAAEITFLIGVTATGAVAAKAFATWQSDAPATYSATSQVYKWGSATAGTTGGTVSYFFAAASNWTTTEKNGLVSGLSLWSAEANIKFTLAASAAAAGVIFTRGSDGGAFASSTSSGAPVGGSTLGSLTSQVTISIDTSVAGFGQIGEGFNRHGAYSYSTLVHEEGHMLGFGHGGAYNAGDGNGSVPSRQFSIYDNRLWTIMSYIQPDDTSAAFFNAYTTKGTSWGLVTDPGDGLDYSAVSTTPMMLDILAAQRLYGAPTSGPLASGGQVFGFNCNIAGSATDSSIRRYFDFTVNTSPVVTLWDAGTRNTLDLSGFSAGSTISLLPGTFTSAAGLVNNIAIAEDTTIETAYGGSGGDTLIANNVGDFLYGNGGDDTLLSGAGSDLLNGGGGTNTASYVNSTAAVSINLATGAASGGWAAGDTLTNIQNVTGSNGNDTLIGTAGANILRGGAGDDVLQGGGGADTLDGGTGFNVAAFQLASTAVTTTVTGASSMTVATGTGTSGLTNMQEVTFTDEAQLLGSLTVANATTVSNLVVLAGASLQNNGTLAITTATPLVESGLITGSGTLTVAAGSRVAFRSSATYTGATTVQGTLAIGAGGLLTGTAQIALAASGAVLDLTSAGSDQAIKGLSLASGAAVHLGGTTAMVANAATFNGGVVDGTGKLITASTDTIAALTIGGATLLRNNGGVTQTGTITLGDSSNGAARMTNAAGKTWALTGDGGIAKASTAAVFNTGGGSFSKTGGTGLSKIGVDLINLNAATSQITVASGTLDFAGAVSGSQAFAINAGRTLQFDASVAGGSTVRFAGAGGTLLLNDAQDFKGAITGFGTGQKLDLASIAFASPGTTLAYGGSTLTVAGGGKTASLALGTGYNPASFHLANDTHGGSLLTYG